MALANSTCCINGGSQFQAAELKTIHSRNGVSSPLNIQFLNQRRNLGFCSDDSRWQKSHSTRQKPASPKSMSRMFMGKSHSVIFMCAGRQINPRPEFGEPVLYAGLFS